MPAYILKELPEAFAIAVDQIIERKKSDISSAESQARAEIHARFREEIIHRQSPQELSTRDRKDVSRDWWMYELNLEKPWKDVKQIRVFSHKLNNSSETYVREESTSVFKKKYKQNIYFESVIVLKKTNAQFEVFYLEEEDSRAINLYLPTISHRKRLGVLEQAPIKYTSWDNLKIYSKDVSSFYSSQNSAMAFTLFHWINQRKRHKPFLIVDLGSGRGEMANTFMKYISTKGYELADTYWLNVDLNEENTNIAGQNVAHHRISCIKAHAKKFVQDPLFYLREAEVDEKFWKNSDIYILASGLLTEGVMNFSDSVETFRAFRNEPNVRGVLLTGMHATQITPYMAKQLGFERLNEPLHVMTKDSIDIFQPIAVDKQVERIIHKMHAHGVLDLSYVSCLSEILSALEKQDLSSVEHILFAGVSVDNSHMLAFTKLLEKYTQLKIWGASINPLEKSQLDNLIATIRYSMRCISLGYIVAAPAFSPTFFPKFSHTTNESSEHSLLVHFMRGIIANVVTRALIPMEHRLLTVKLFLTLNNDQSINHTKTLIHELLKREILDFPDKITMDDLLAQVKISSMGEQLKAAAYDFIQSVPIDCFCINEGTVFALKSTQPSLKN